MQVFQIICCLCGKIFSIAESMRLSRMKKLIGVLAIGMQLSVVNSILGVSSFSCEEQENIVSAIGFLMLLKRRKGTDEAFLVELKRLLSVCNEEELLTKITCFEEDNPDLLTENATPFRSVGSVVYDFEPTQIQSHCFKKALYEIGGLIGKRELEILVALTPIPEAGKENIKFGHELFHQMERHGCISENDTELLQEMLELLELRGALQILLKYRLEFSSNSSKGDGDSVTQESDRLSPPIEEVSQGSSSELGNGKESAGIWPWCFWNTFLCTKLGGVASNLSHSSRVLDPATHLQSEMSTSVEILSSSSFNPKEQPLSDLQAGLDSSNGSCSRDLDDGDSTSLQHSEIKLILKLLPRRKRPRADDKERYPIKKGNDDRGSCDLVDSPPSPKALCLASISDDDSESVLFPKDSNDGTDIHCKTQSLPVTFTSSASVCTKSGFFHSTDPPECTTSLGCQEQGY